MQNNANIVGHFEKVTYRYFLTAMQEEFPDMSEVAIRAAYAGLEMPKRATSGSAGYDFKSPIAFALQPGQTIKIPTGVRVKIDEGWWLGCLPRSGHGFKYRCQLDNTLGVIDSDFYYSDGEGQIFLKLTNDGHGDKTMYVKVGDGFAQGIFLPYGITDDDEATDKRNGGFGSTDKK